MRLPFGCFGGLDGEIAVMVGLENLPRLPLVEFSQGRSGAFSLVWTEQHLLQAFLMFNSAFEVALALNYLHMHHREVLAHAAPVYGQQLSSKPASFWIRRKLDTA